MTVFACPLPRQFWQKSCRFAFTISLLCLGSAHVSAQQWSPWKLTDRPLPEVRTSSAIESVTPHSGGVVATLSPTIRTAGFSKEVDSQYLPTTAAQEFAVPAQPIIGIEPVQITAQPDPLEAPVREFQPLIANEIPRAYPVSTQNNSQEAWIAYELQANQIIHVGDQLEISFPYRPTFNQLLTVRDDGFINPSLVSLVMAAGKTPETVQEEIRALYDSLNYSARDNAVRAKSRKYLIQVGDELEIRFSAVPELSQIAVIRPDGRITLPRVGQVLAEGQSPEELAQQLMVKFGTLLKNPELVVIVRKYSENTVYVDGRATHVGLVGLDELSVRIVRQAPRLVYVTGEVGAPAAISFLPGMTAHRAIVTAGGFKRSGAKHRVVIMRRTDPTKSCEMTVNLQPHTFARKLLWKDGGYLDVPLRPDDVVIIPKTSVAKVQDFLDEYVYNMFPITRNSNLSLFYDLRGNNLVPGTVNP